MLHVLLLLSFQKSSINVAQGPGNRYAFIVGIDRYEDTSIPELTGAVADAKAIASALIGHCNFPQKNVILLTSDSPSPDLRPTRQNLLRQSARFQTFPAGKQFTKNDIVFLYYAGHAFEISGGAYVIPMDAMWSTTKILGDYSHIEGTAETSGGGSSGGPRFAPEQMNLLEASIVFRLVNLPVKTVIAGFDMCRTGAGDSVDSSGKTRSVLTTSILNTTNITRSISLTGSGDGGQTDQPSSIVMYACQPGKASFEANGRGFFSLALERALTTSAADKNKDGVIDGDELKNYLEIAVPALSGKKQQPLIKSEGPGLGGLPISNVKPGTALPAAKVAEEVKAIETTTTETRNLAFQKGIWQYLPGKQWCDIVSNEGLFTIRMPVRIQPDRPVHRDVRQVTTQVNKKESFTSDLVSYYYDEAPGYLYYRFGASFVDYPRAKWDSKNPDRVLDWGEALMKDKDMKVAFGTDLDNFFKSFGKSITLTGVLGFDKNKPKDVVQREVFKVGQFPGRRFVVYKADGAVQIIQLAAIENRLYIFQEQYDGGRKNPPFPPKYFVDSLSFFPEVLTTPEAILPIFNSGS